MDLLFYRYRHLTVLLVAIVAQLGLLAYQVRNDQDVRLIRVWSVTAITPVARVLDGARSGTSSFIDDYFLLLGTRQENKRLRTELDRVLLEAQQMRAQLDTAEKAEALALFQKESPLKTVPARVFANTTGANTSGVATTVFIDVGSTQGIRKGMAVITPDGIVGKVIDVHPITSMVLLMSDPSFAAGVVSQKNKVQGTLKGQGNDAPIVDFVQNEQQVDKDEWFYTSGDDFVFPRGLRVGTAAVVKNGLRVKDIQIRPSGFSSKVEAVLVITEGVHAPIPAAATEATPMSMQAPPETAPTEGPAQAAEVGPLATEADRVIDRLRAKQAPKAPPTPDPNATAPSSGTPAPSAPKAVAPPTR
jgi:rod shape-determining protein MreC